MEATAARPVCEAAAHSRSTPAPFDNGLMGAAGMPGTSFHTWALLEWLLMGGGPAAQDMGGYMINDPSHEGELLIIDNGYKAAFAECLSEGASAERKAYCDENWKQFIH